jgi:toxin-antitoxin system PIN domain toxin
MSGILVDTSVWVALFFEEHQSFSAASSFIASRGSTEPALLCRATEQSWLRLATTASLHRLYRTASVTNREAVAVLSNWRSQPHIDCLETEPKGTRDLWLELAEIPSASPKIWMDAYLAAIAIRADLPLATLDTDFQRFEPHGLSMHLLR